MNPTVCLCCSAFLPTRALREQHFCPRCEGHRDWCTPMRPRPLTRWNPAVKRYEIRSVLDRPIDREQLTDTEDGEDVFGQVQPDKSKYDLEMDKYIVRVVKLEPCSSQYGNGKAVKWYFNVAHRGDPPVAITDASTGGKMELWQFSDAELTPNSRPGKWAAALLQREINIGDDGEQIAAELLGKTALAMIGPSKQGKQNTILAMEPYVKPKASNGNGPAKIEPAPAPESFLTAEETAAGTAASDEGF